MIRCELLIDGYAYNVTDSLVNWADVEMKWKREELNGVIRSFTTKFEFAGGAYSLLVNEWVTKYLKASASVVFYVRNNSWLWDEKFRCALDFSTFTYNGTTCEINAIDDSLASLIKSKNGTEYEYSVDMVKEGNLLKYDRLSMQNKINWTFAGETGIEVEGADPQKGDNSIPLYIHTSEIYNKNVVEVYDSNIGVGGPIFKALRVVTIHISTAFFVYFSFSSSQAQYKVRLIKKRNTGAETVLFSKDCIHQTRVEIDMDVSMNTNEELYLVYTFDYNPSSHKYLGCNGIAPTITFIAKGDVVELPVVSPVTLLNRLLKSMNGGREGLIGAIASDERLDKTMLLAAESARDMKNAKIRTSYNKFVKWMEAEFGFVPVIGENSVSFVPRNSLFKDNEIKHLEDFTDFELTTDEGMVYSRVRVGYDKVDYEGVNGKDEFRFTQDYTTGVSVADSTLDLISPYRADAYGIEFLVAKRGEDTTDNKSDNDVFMVGVNLNNGEYILDRSVEISGVISSSTMFNCMYSQLDMIRANESYLGIFSTMLEYASSDGNSDVVIGGTSLKSDVEINDSLCKAAHVSVTTDGTDIPTELDGYVSFDKGGLTYKGYIYEVGLNIGKGESVTYDMIVKEIRD